MARKTKKTKKAVVKKVKPCDGQIIIMRSAIENLIKRHLETDPFGEDVVVTKLAWQSEGALLCEYSEP